VIAGADRFSTFIGEKPYAEGRGDQTDLSISAEDMAIVRRVRAAGAQWNGNFTVFGPPFDDRLVYTCHRYWSDTMQQAIQNFLDFRATYSAPIWMGESGENTDGWIDAFRRLFESQNIGWCFWPYEKMDVRSCMVTFDRPEGSGLIVKYANADRSTFEAKRKARSDVEKVRKALAEFLKNCRFDRTRVNERYLWALGLR